MNLGLVEPDVRTCDRTQHLHEVDHHIYDKTPLHLARTPLVSNIQNPKATLDEELGKP